MRKKKVKLDRYYLVNLSNLSKPFAYDHAYPEKVLAEGSLKYYYSSEDGVMDIYKGSKVILFGLKLKRCPKPKYPPSLERNHSSEGAVQALRARGNNIRAYPFKKLWEPLPTTRLERRKKVREGRNPVRLIFLK